MNARRLLLGWTLILSAASPGVQAQVPLAAPEQVWIAVESPGADAVKLEATLYRPPGNGPFPLALVSHGSTGGGAVSPRLTLRPETLAPLLVARGIVVLAPMRRGRGASGGSYDEPYGCDYGGAQRGLENAMADTDAALAYARTLPYVDSSRVLLAGSSRGGLLSIAYAQRRPGIAAGIVNFVGGWHGDTCPNDFNRYVFRRAGAAVTVPTLWLYTENDRYYSPRSIRAYANEFESAGGRVTLRVYPPQGADGHYLTRYPDVWRGDLESFLDRLGLPARP